MPAWDPSLVDPTQTPADAGIIRSPGGRTGNLSLENGQVLAFPWKRQQQVPGTRPGSIRVFDDATTEYLDLKAPTLVAGGDLAYIYLAGWADGTASIGMSNGEVNLFLASGTMAVSGGKAFFSDGIDVAGGFSDFRSDAGEDIQLISGGKIRLEAAEEIRLTGDLGIVIVNDSTTGTDITIQSNRDLLLNVDRDCIVTSTTGDFIADVAVDINLLANANWLAEGATMGLQTTGGDIIVSSSSGGTINLNPGNTRAVQVNSYVVAPLRNVDTAIVGTAPSTTGDTPGYVFQAGKQGVTTVSGIGTLTFPTAFTAGLLSVVCQGTNSDLVVAVNLGAVSATSVGVVLYQAGALVADGTYTLSYIAIGW